MGDERCREAVSARDALPTPIAPGQEPLLLLGERRAGRAAEDEGQRGGTVTEHCSRAQRSAPGRPSSRLGSSKNTGYLASVGVFPPARSALSGRVPAALAPETLRPASGEALGRWALGRVRVLPRPPCTRRHSLSECFVAGGSVMGRGSELGMGRL